MAGRLSLHVDFILQVQATTIVFDYTDTGLASNSNLADS